MASRSSGTAQAVNSAPAARWGRYLQRQGLDSAAAYNFTRPPSFPGPMRRLLPKKPIRAISQLTDSANFAISPTAKDSEDNPGNGMTPRVRACCVAALLVYAVRSTAQVGVESPPVSPKVGYAPAATTGQQPGMAVSPFASTPFAAPPVTGNSENDKPDSQEKQELVEPAKLPTIVNPCPRWPW